MIGGSADAQRGNRGNANDDGGQPLQYRPIDATQTPAPQTVVTRNINGEIVAETTNGDDISVQISSSPQSPSVQVSQVQPVQVSPGQQVIQEPRPQGQGFQGQRPQGQGAQGQRQQGQGGFQPGQGVPGQTMPVRQEGQPIPGEQPGEVQDGVAPDGQPGQRPMQPRANRPTINTPNPDIRPEDFNVLGNDRRIRLRFDGMAWREVIGWFASEAGLTLELESAPPGSFSYRDETGKTYSIDETFSLLNSYLIRRNFLMYRTGQMLMLVNLADGIPIDLIRDVPLAKLDEIGDYEVVRVLFTLTGTTPDVIQAEIQQFLGPQGMIVPLAKSQQIYVTEFGDKLRTIREIIQNIDDPKVIAIVKRVMLENISADMALAQLKLMLSLSDNDSTLRANIDATGKTIWLSGRVDRVNMADYYLQQIDAIPVDTTDVTFKVYPIPSADPRIALAVVQTLLAGRPDVRVSLDSTIGAICVQGRAEDHQKVVDAIEELEKSGVTTETIQLSRISTTTAKEAIDSFYNGGTNSSSQPRNPFAGGSGGGGGGTSSTSSSSVPAPIVTTVPTLKQLIVKGTKSQIMQIKTLLTQMGEPNLFAGGGQSPVNQNQIGFVPATENQSKIMLQLAQPLWLQMGNSPIKITTTQDIIQRQAGQGAPSVVPFNNPPFNNQSGIPFNQQPGQFPFAPNPSVPKPAPQSIGGVQLPPEYPQDVPRERIHVIDGFAGENAPREVQQPVLIQPQPVQPQSLQQQPLQLQPVQPQPLQQPLQPQPTMPYQQWVPPMSNNAPVVNAPLTSNRSQLDLHLDSLFGPAETTQELPATLPVFVPSTAAPIAPQSVPSINHLTTQSSQSAGGRYSPVVWQQEVPETPTVGQETVTPVAVVEPEDSDVVITDRDVLTVLMPEDHQGKLFGIVPNANASNSRITELGQQHVPTVQPVPVPAPAFVSPDTEINRAIPFGTFPITPPGTMFPHGTAVTPALPPHSDVSVSVGPTGLFIHGNPDQVDQFEQLLHALNNEGILKSQSTEFYLIKNAKADTVKTMLTTMLGTYSSTSSASDPLAGIPSDPVGAMVAGMVGGTKIQATGPYDIYVDTRSNMLIINANRVDHLTIQELLPIFDRLGRTDDVLINSKPNLIKLEYMKAEDAETAVRTIFAENLQGGGNRGAGGNQPGNRGGQPGAQPGGAAAPMMMFNPGGMAGGGPQQAIMDMIQQRMGAQGGRGGTGTTQVEVQTMTLAVEKTTNSLIVYSPEELFLQVQAFVKELDRMSQGLGQTTDIVRYDQNSSARIQYALTALLGNSVTVRNQSTTGTGNRNAGAGNRAGGGGFTGGIPGGGGFGGGGLPGGMGGAAGGGAINRGVGGGFGGGAPIIRGN